MSNSLIVQKWFDSDLDATTGNSATWVASGGLQFGGAAGIIRQRVSISAGGIVFGGAVAEIRTAVRAAVGGILFGGTATPIAVHVVRTTAGGIQFGGTAAEIRQAIRVATGGLQFGGAALVTRAIDKIATGGIVFGGAAVVGKSKQYASTGGIIFGGAAGYSTQSGGAAAVKTFVSYARVWNFNAVRDVYMTTFAFKTAVESDLRGAKIWTRYAPATTPNFGDSLYDVNVRAIPGVVPLKEDGHPEGHDGPPDK